MKRHRRLFSGELIESFDVTPISYAEVDGNILFKFNVSDFNLSYFKLSEQPVEDAWIVELSDKTSKGICGLLAFVVDHFQFTTGNALFNFELKSDFEKWLKGRKVYRLGVHEYGCVCYSVAPEKGDLPDLYCETDIFDQLDIKITRYSADQPNQVDL